MAFSDIPKIEEYKFYVDTAFHKAQKVQISDQKKKQIDKINIVSDALKSYMVKILKRFPQVDDLEPFYRELLQATVDFNRLKKSLGSLNWSAKQITILQKKYLRRMRPTDRDDIKRLNHTRREFYGRTNSVMKQISDDLKALEQVRRILKDFPVIKTKMRTACIIGFPNVGKTTLLYKLTGSKGNIEPYAFTTQGVNVSYYKTLQLLDTPGTLNREDKMNVIELTSHIAVKHLADFLIYVFDPTEASIDLDEQLRLYKKIMKYKKKTYVYISKTDQTKPTEELKKLNPLSIKELKEQIDKELIENPIDDFTMP